MDSILWFIDGIFVLAIIKSVSLLSCRTLYVCMYLHVLVCVCTYLYIFACICMYLHVSVRICMYFHVFLCVCVRFASATD